MVNFHPFTADFQIFSPCSLYFPCHRLLVISTACPTSSLYSCPQPISHLSHQPSPLPSNLLPEPGTSERWQWPGSVPDPPTGPLQLLLLLRLLQRWPSSGSLSPNICLSKAKLSYSRHILELDQNVQVRGLTFSVHDATGVSLIFQHPLARSSGQQFSLK